MVEGGRWHKFIAAESEKEGAKGQNFWLLLGGFPKAAIQQNPLFFCHIEATVVSGIGLICWTIVRDRRTGIGIGILRPQ